MHELPHVEIKKEIKDCKGFIFICMDGRSKSDKDLVDMRASCSVFASNLHGSPVSSLNIYMAPCDERSSIFNLEAAVANVSGHSSFKSDTANNESYDSLALIIAFNNAPRPFGMSKTATEDSRANLAYDLSKFKRVIFIATDKFKAEIVHVPYFAKIGELARIHPPKVSLKLFAFVNDTLRHVFDCNKLPEWFHRRSESLKKTYDSKKTTKSSSAESKPKKPKLTAATRMPVEPMPVEPMPVEPVAQDNEVSNYLITGYRKMECKTQAFCGISLTDCLDLFNEFCIEEFVRKAYMIDVKTDQIAAIFELKPVLTVKPKSLKEVKLI